MKINIVFILVFSFSLSFPGFVFSQDNRFRYKATDQTGFFCGHEEYEGGEISILITNNQGSYYLSLKDPDEHMDFIYSLKKDTPVKFDIEIYETLYDNQTKVMTLFEISKLTKTGEPQPGSCKASK
jgi:hypothetical protein